MVELASAKSLVDVVAWGYEDCGGEDEGEDGEGGGVEDAEEGDVRWAADVGMHAVDIESMMSTKYVLQQRQWISENLSSLK